MISVVLPCRNEEKTIGICIKKIRQVLEGRDYEIIVSDSSHDNSANIAEKEGAIVVKHNKEGYGNACIEGFKQAKGEILIMGDADNTYDFLEIPKLLKYIDNYDLVMGRRKFIHKGAMPLLHKYIGNPFLSSVLSLFFHKSIKDTHSGLRVIKKKAFEKLNLRTGGMEFASEMIIKAIKNNLKIKETPIHYYKREGISKLETFSDGWKHLRFMLLYSPFFLFLMPGLFVFLLGFFLMGFLYFDLIAIGSFRLFYHPMFAASLGMIIGYQLMIFALFAKTYTTTHLGEKSRLVTMINKYMTIERASLIGILVILLGLITGISIVVKWFNTGFGELQEIKNSIIAITLIILGIQTIFSSFMLSILGIKER